MKVRGTKTAVLCVLFDAGSRSTMNWKLAGGEGVYLSFTGVGGSAELLQVSSRDILSVHWTHAATHQDGAGLEKCCDVSIIKQHLRFFEKRENHGMYGAMLTAATAACWPKTGSWSFPRRAGWMLCGRCGAVRGRFFPPIQAAFRLAMLRR